MYEGSYFSKKLSLVVSLQISPDATRQSISGAKFGFRMVLS